MTQPGQSITQELEIRKVNKIGLLNPSPGAVLFNWSFVTRHIFVLSSTNTRAPRTSFGRNVCARALARAIATRGLVESCKGQVWAYTTSLQLIRRHRGEREGLRQVVNHNTLTSKDQHRPRKTRRETRDRGQKTRDETRERKGERRERKERRESKKRETREERRETRGE